MKASSLQHKEGETDEQRLECLAHNLFMKYNRSIKSNPAPLYIAPSCKGTIYTNWFPIIMI